MNSTGWCGDRKSTRLNSSHVEISYAVFCLKKKIAPLWRYTPVHHKESHPESRLRPDPVRAFAVRRFPSHGARVLVWFAADGEGRVRRHAGLCHVPRKRLRWTRCCAVLPIQHLHHQSKGQRELHLVVAHSQAKHWRI